MQALLNPLQALFNAFVYRKWGDTKTVVVFPWSKWKGAPAETSYLMNSESPSGNSRETESESSKSSSFNGYGSL
jgi:hypothetical protein